MRARFSGWLVAGCVIVLHATPLSGEELRLSTPLPTSPAQGRSSAAAAMEPGDALQSLAAQYSTPKAIAQFLHRSFTFQRDEDLFGQAEYWQTPQEFLARRAGDCEDYALLATALLTRNGIEAHVFSLFGDGGYAHTVCVFRDAQGRYNVINQDQLRNYRAKNLDALACQMYPAWTFGGITEQAGIRGRLVEEITNPHPVPAMAAFDSFASFQY